MASVAKNKSARRISGIMRFPDADMRRATRLSEVLRCGGRILADSTGSVDTYDLSAPVDKIDAFISHNWATGRSAKFLVLAIHFNGDAAVFVAIACCLLASIVLAAGVAPVYEGNYLTGYLATPCTLPAYLIALLLKHELLALVGCRGPRIFLDKACIDQRTEDAKIAGIRNLAAFLNESSCMVVCYTDLYLRKLWTVYEMATFIQVRGEDAAREIHLLPTGLCFLSIICSSIFYVLVNILRLLAMSRAEMGNTTLVANLFVVVATTCLVIPLRAWMKRRAKARDACGAFDIREALCASEEDRQLVTANSIAMMKAYGYCRKDVEDQEAIEAFNELVREVVPQAFMASTGRLGIPYRFILPTCIVGFSWGMDKKMAMVAPAAPPVPLQQVFLSVLMTLINAFCVLPLSAALEMFATRSCIHFSGFKEALYTLSVTAAGSATYIACDTQNGLMSLIYLRSTASNAAYGVCVVYALVMLILTVWVYRPVRPPLVHRRKSESGMTVSEENAGLSPRSSRTSCTLGSMHARISAVVEEPNVVVAREAFCCDEVGGASGLEIVRQALYCDLFAGASDGASDQKRVKQAI